VRDVIENLTRWVNLGVVEGRSPAEARRVQAINVVGLLAIFTNVAYIIAFLLIDASALRTAIITMTVAIVLLFRVLALNARGSTNAATGLMFVVGPLNLTIVSMLMGIGTGTFLFLMIVPITAVLISPPHNWQIQLGGILAGMAPFVAVLLAHPAVPDVIEGTAVETGLLVVNSIVTTLFITVMGLHYRQIADTAEAELVLANESSERLLLNILPEKIADRLKAGEAVIADRADAVTILFADLVGSTPMSERLTPGEMVEVLNEVFTPFDDLAVALGLEKIKTVGDAYMVVGGLPMARPDHVEAIADMALAMREEVARHTVEGFGPLEMRFGIHTGPVVAGVIGKQKFSYDLWGDTVNTAARMESHGVPGKIQVTAAVRDRLQDRYRLEQRGPIQIKGKGVMETYFLETRIG
jgi:class 3 adenylate cyclase